MSISVCPKCREDVSLPVAAADARVRCPLCQEEYTLSEALADLPPTLIIVSAGTVDVAGGGELHLEALEEGDSGSASFSFDETEAPQSVAPSYGRNSLAVSSRPSAKDKSAMPIIQVIAGGMAAIPASMLILWWGFGTDPLDLGPSVARYVPVIVPVALRGDAALDDAWENENSDFTFEEWPSPNNNGQVLGGDESGFGRDALRKESAKTGGESPFLPESVDDSIPVESEAKTTSDSLEISPPKLDLDPTEKPSDEK